MTTDRKSRFSTSGAILAVLIIVTAAAAQSTTSTGDAALDAKRETLSRDYASLLEAELRFKQAHKAYEEAVENAKTSLPANVLRTHQAFLEKNGSDVIKVVAAAYGVPNSKVDVTREVTTLLRSQKAVVVDPHTFGDRDPAFGMTKALTLHLEFDGFPLRIVTGDSGSITLTPKP